jgi:hypothetical protein
MYRLHRFVVAAMALVTAALVGCGSDGPELVNVTGIVTLDGKPIPNAVVTFNPVAAGGSNSMGKTDAKGRYQLEFSQDKKGALVGEHVVEIATKKVSASDMPDTGEVVSTEYVAIPAKYRKRGTLKAEVSKSKNQIDFQLDSK